MYFFPGTPRAVLHRERERRLLIDRLKRRVPFQMDSHLLQQDPVQFNLGVNILSRPSTEAINRGHVEVKNDLAERRVASRPEFSEAKRDRQHADAKHGQQLAPARRSRSAAARELNFFPS